MNLFALSLAYLRARALNTALNVLLLALGVATIVLLILIGAQLEQRLTQDARGVDLVIGAKGSPLQLILSSIYHVDVPTGNIPLEEARRWAGHPLVEAAIPVALGDNVAGFRIVGTEHDYARHYGAVPAAGRLWHAPLEATLGAEAARRTGLGLGDQFIGSHGMVGDGLPHEEHPYQVVGVLEPSGSVLDRLVLTSVESVWQAHGIEPEEEARDGAHDEEHAQTQGAAPRRPPEVTALLVRYRSPLGAVQLPRLVNQESALQAASPAYEIARLLSFLGLGLATLRAFGLLLIGAAGLSLFIALFSAMQERAYDLAVMRTLGASRGTLFLQPLIEGLLLAGAGAALGLLLGHGVVELLGRFVPDLQMVGLSGLDARAEEVYLIGLVALVGLLAALLPALQAYRTDIAAVLATRA